jgi:hypothetical protein
MMRADSRFHVSSSPTLAVTSSAVSGIGALGVTLTLLSLRGSVPKRCTAPIHKRLSIYMTAAEALDLAQSLVRIASA